MALVRADSLGNSDLSKVTQFLACAAVRQTTSLCSATYRDGRLAVEGSLGVHVVKQHDGASHGTHAQEVDVVVVESGRKS